MCLRDSRSEELYSYSRERERDDARAGHGFLCPLEALLLLRLGSSVELDSLLTSTAMKSVFLVLSWSRCMQQVTQLIECSCFRKQGVE